MANKGFPISPGLYIAQRDYDVVLLKITGMYPTFTVGKTLYLTSLISSNTLKEASKDIVNNIILFSDKWKFTQLEGIDMRVFPKLAFKPDGHLDLSTDELLSVQITYYRMRQSGVSLSKIMWALVYEYKVPMEQISKMIELFDNRSSHAY